MNTELELRLYATAGSFRDALRDAVSEAGAEAALSDVATMGVRAHIDGLIESPKPREATTVVCDDDSFDVRAIPLIPGQYDLEIRIDIRDRVVVMSDASLSDATLRGIIRACIGAHAHGVEAGRQQKEAELRRCIGVVE